MHTAVRTVLARLPSGVDVATTVHVYGTAATAVREAIGDGTAGEAATASKIPQLATAVTEADGPVLYVQAAQHGREVNGVEVCRRLHRRLLGHDSEATDRGSADGDGPRAGADGDGNGVDAPPAATLDGTVVVVPVTDPLTFDRVSYTTPEELDAVSPNMNRVWPGDADGSVHERMAATLWPLVTAADAGVDLHTGSLSMATHVVYQQGDSASRALAVAFGVDLLLAEPAGDDASDEWHDRGFAGKFRVAAAEAGLPTITPELAHNRELVPEAVAAGVDGLVDVCRHVGIMADADPAVTNEDAWADGQDGDPTYARNHLGRVRAADAGLFVPAEGVSTGDEVTAGDVLGAVYDPTTYDRLQTVAVDRDGLLYSVAREATVSAGATLVGVAERLPPGER
jgi:predicted deacylase